MNVKTYLKNCASLLHVCHQLKAWCLKYAGRTISSLANTSRFHEKQLCI